MSGTDNTPTIAELEAEIVRTREGLVRTVDELSTRLDPRYQANQAVVGARKIVRDAIGSDPAADPHAKTRARTILATGVAVVSLLAAAALRKH
jgi:hypothetical protein